MLGVILVYCSHVYRIGLLCNPQGCPIAVEVFEGNTSDTTTLGKQIEKVRVRFGLSKIIWVGDRGMITQTRINQELSSCEELDWITALTAPQIKKLAQKEVIQLGLFDQQNLVEVESVDYPGERLIACRNPLRAKSSALSREKLLQKTEVELEKIVQATLREKRALKGADSIGMELVLLSVQKKLCLKFKQRRHRITYLYTVFQR